MIKDLTLVPRMSEKAYGLSETSRTYVFEVPRSANKLSVAQAVEAQFEVKVGTVNVAVFKGKAKRTLYKGGRQVSRGQRATTKRAYVTLHEGQSISLYAAAEEEEAKQEKLSKAMEKAQAKVDKKAAKEAK